MNDETGFECASAQETLATAPNILAMLPASWGPRAGTARAAVALARRGPESIRMTAPVHCAVILLTSQGRRVAGLATDRRQEFQAPVGTLELFPATRDVFLQWWEPMENLFLAIEPDWLAEIARREFHADGIELCPPPAGTIDHQSLRLALALKAEIERAEGASTFYIDGLLTAMAVHFLRDHSTLRERIPHSNTFRRGGLSPRVQREIESFMYENLSRPISLAELASLAGLSYSHFLRAFRETTGMPPHRYLLDLRVRKAERLAVGTDLPLKEIALQAGFSNQSHMTCCLRRILSTTPGELRRLRKAQL